MSRRRATRPPVKVQVEPLEARQLPSSGLTGLRLRLSPAAAAWAHHPLFPWPAASSPAYPASVDAAAVARFQARAAATARAWGLPPLTFSPRPLDAAAAQLGSLTWRPPAFPRPGVMTTPPAAALGYGAPLGWFTPGARPVMAWPRPVTPPVVPPGLPPKPNPKPAGPPSPAPGAGVPPITAASLPGPSGGTLGFGGGPPPHTSGIYGGTDLQPCWCTNNGVGGGYDSVLKSEAGGGGGSSGGGGGSGGSNGSGGGNRILDSDVGPITGEYLLDHAAGGYQSQGVARGLDLQYNSLQADARPVLAFVLNSPSGVSSTEVSTVTAAYTVNGIGQSAVTYNSPSAPSGSAVRFPLQMDETANATGVLDAQLSVTLHFSDGTTSNTTTPDKPFAMVNNANSPLGAGWSVGGLFRVFSGTYGVMVTVGSRSGELFTPTGGSSYAGGMGGSFVLTYNSGSTTWTMTAPDGTVVQFDSSGREVSATDRNGNATAYAYVASGAAAGALRTVTDPVGLVTTLSYDSYGHLSTVTDPAGRVTTFAVDSSNGNLTQVTDPDGAVTTYGYSTPSDHRITTETNPNGRTATVTYDSFGRVDHEALFGGGATTYVSPAEEKKLVAAGGSVTGLSLVADYAGSVTDPNGHTTTVHFDATDHSSSVTDPLGETTYVQRDSNDYPEQVLDPNGNTTYDTFDANGNLVDLKRADNTLLWSASYDSYGQPTRVADFRGLVTTFTRDGSGNLTRRTDPDGGHEDFTYDAAGRVLTDTDRNGHTTSFSYDSYGRLTTVTYPGAGTPTAHLGYDAAGDVTSATDELGQTLTYTYDQAGRLRTSQDPVQAAAGATKVTTFAYDADGDLTSVTDALGHVTSYGYDARDRLVTVTDPVNQGTSHRTTFVYDGRGNVTSVTDPNGHVNAYGYDADDRLVTATDPLSHVATYTYDDAGRLTSATDPNGHSTAYGYDVDDRVTSVTRPGPVTYTYAYDGDDNVTSVTDPLGHRTTFTFDNLNRLTARTVSPDGTTLLRTSYGYDAAGNETTVTDGLGHVTSYGYDARDRRVTETQPTGGGTTTYAYDAASRLLSLTDPVGNVTSYGYDAADRVTTATDPRGKVTTYAYDLVGNLTQKTDRDNRTIQYGYDADDRPVTETWVGASPANTVTMTYDPAGRLTGVQDAGSRYAYTYDNAGRVLTADDGGTTGLPQVTLTYSYDDAGNRTGLDDSLGGLTSYTYDARDDLTVLTQSGTGVAAKRVNFAYDSASRLTTLTRWSDTAGTSFVAGTTYAYDQADRLTGITHYAAGPAAVASYAYTLDAAGRLTSEARAWAGGASTDTVGYSYTNNDQLTGVTHTNGSFAGESFGYDANGNRNTTGYSTGTGNELTGDGVYTYSYDDEGNQASRTKVSDGSQTAYHWDYRNRLTEVDSVVGGVTTVLATYTYDALDRRIGVAEGGATRWTLYDGASPVLDFNGSGTQTARYLQGGAVDELLARETSGGAVAWYLEDRLGTVRDLVDNTGAVIDHVDYGVYGNVTGETSPSSGDGFKYAGMRYDTVIGVYYDEARWYDPGSGRFLRQDPIGFASGDADTYRYVENDPANGVDPDGMDGSWALGLLKKFDDYSPTGLVRAQWHDVVDPMLTVWDNTGAEGRGPFERGAIAVGTGLATGVGVRQLDDARTGVDAVDGHDQTLFESLVDFGDGAVRLVGTGRAGLGVLRTRFPKLGGPKASSCLDTSCFAAGTPLLTPGGSKPIEEFQPGDWVLAVPDDGPETPPEPRRVLNLIHKYSPLLALGVGGQTVLTTGTHPFWVRGRGWTEAAQLMVGDHLRSHDGRWVVLQTAEDTGGTAPVYNVEVEDYHTYFVGSPFWGFSVWSHNEAGCGEGMAPHLEPHVQGVKAAGKYDASVGSLDEARQVIGKAMPGAVELPSAVAGQPYAGPPPGVKKWFQVQPAEPKVGNMHPHIKYVDWSQGKRGKGGSWGHIFFPE